MAVVPAIGLLLVGFISTYLAKEVKGHGVPQILEALALRGGRIRPRVGALGVLAPAITIGAGGSVGREGPIALIGAAFGSTLGQFLRLPDKYLSLLVACGAAGGIAATFNAPIAGAFFGLEVVLGSYAMGAVVPVFVSALIAVTVFTHFMGSDPVLAIPQLGLHHPIEILFMLILGVLGGLMGFAYTRGLYFAEDLFDHWSVPWWAKNVSGGLAVGILGLFIPQVLGVGYSTMHLAIMGRMALGGFLLLLITKYAATLLTIGAGGSGGVFAPSLFLGAMLGGLYGSLLHLIFPQLIGSSAVYAAVGMAGVFAGAAQAPFVAITILLEITGDYRLTAAVMAAAVISYIVYGSLYRDSMYTVRLTRRGIAILRGTDVRLEERLAVGTILARPPEALQATATVREATEALAASVAEAMAVLDEKNTFMGIVTLAGLRAAREEGSWEGEIRSLTTPVPTLFNDDSLDLAMRRLAVYDVPALAVLAKTSGELLGLLTTADLVKAYNTQTTRSLDLERRRRNLGTTGTTGGLFREVSVGPDSPLAGRPLREIPWPTEAVAVSVRRSGQTLVPHGETRLLAGDLVLLFGFSPALLELEKAFAPPLNSVS